ncbi:MAG: nucleotidyltransferase family protein [Pseudomonadales bacterium]|nr:nucleotidyltransferase family protein [Pseudomonadales bacterium]MCP5331250.1 nucleotidyltransferase family protein [Pseudomonadales bacterium]MCP5344897.1 nucleotidyltransferase family protein [Pseudomonadales bacterium]
MAKEPLQQKPGQQDVPLTTGVILLAAGFSRRFGSIKLNALLPNGKPLVQQTLERIQAATDNVIVVTREELLASLLQAGAPTEHTLLCPDADQGMGHTLACGMAQVPAHWDAVLVCLADMPFVETRTYTALLNALRPDAIVVPEHQGKRGNPVGFGRKWFAQLAQANGDSGGREVMKGNPNAIVKVAVEDPAVHLDVDVPGDLGQHHV